MGHKVRIDVVSLHRSFGRPLVVPSTCPWTTTWGSFSASPTRIRGGTRESTRRRRKGQSRTARRPRRRRVGHRVREAKSPWQATESSARSTSRTAPHLPRRDPRGRIPLGVRRTASSTFQRGTPPIRSALAISLTNIISTYFVWNETMQKEIFICHFSPRISLTRKILWRTLS